MPSKIPDSHLDLIAGPFYAILTTLSPQGAPENTVVWCSWDGQYVLVNTAAGRRKEVNVRLDPRVALVVIDPDDPMRWIDVRGTVAEIVPDPDFANINAHSRLYDGVDEFYGDKSRADLKGNVQRLIFKIRPDRVVVSSR